MPFGYAGITFFLVDYLHQLGRSDEAMLLMLSEARALHRRADIHLLDGEVPAAIADIREVLAIRFPMGNADGEDTLLDPYAASDPAEFFTVMSEAFFQTPGLLRQDYPAVYEQLKRFYRQNPLV